MQAGLIHGPEFHYLDHLAPLCSFLEIPLVVTEKELKDLALEFYPNLTVLHWHPFEIPDQLVLRFDAVFTATPRALFDEVFYFAQSFQNKRVRTIWVPHGNSDKGRHTTFMEALQEEELILIYGKRMEALLKEKNVHSNTYTVGNYRLQYYEKHKNFYDDLFLSKRRKKPIILYAPTWQDAEKNSSFTDFWPYLLDVPKKFHLVVKLHPNLYQQIPELIEEFKQKLPLNAEVLENFPPIYPILANTALYIGDMSSIGYDFLSFKRPMILLKNSDLLRAGRYLAKENYDKLFDEVTRAIEEGAPKNTLYEETFGITSLQLQSQ